MIPSNQRLGAVEGEASGATDRNSRSFFFRVLRRVNMENRRERREALRI